MNYECIEVAQNQGVTKITFNRPDTLNALSIQLLGEFRDAVEAAAVDESCRCVLLTGAGRAFTSGADLRDAAGDMDVADLDLGQPLRDSYHPILETLRAMPKPYIAAVNGIAAGAGCNFALAADIVIAARSAQFIQAFIRIGLVPDAGGTWCIPRLIGRARALQWMMSGDALDAETALNWGLISEVVDDDRLAAEADALAARLAKAPTLALAQIKKLVDASLQNDFATQTELEARAQTGMGQSHDAVEGIMSFVQKRKPQFKGK